MKEVIAPRSAVNTLPSLMTPQRSSTVISMQILVKTETVALLEQLSGQSIYSSTPLLVLPPPLLSQTHTLSSSLSNVRPLCVVPVPTVRKVVGGAFVSAL